MLEHAVVLLVRSGPLVGHQLVLMERDNGVILRWGRQNHWKQSEEMKAVILMLSSYRNNRNSNSWPPLGLVLFPAPYLLLFCSLSRTLFFLLTPSPSCSLLPRSLLLTVHPSGAWSSLLMSSHFPPCLASHTDSRFPLFSSHIFSVLCLEQEEIEVLVQLGSRPKDASEKVRNTTPHPKHKHSLTALYIPSPESTQPARHAN